MKLIQLAVENKRKQMMQTAQKTGLTSNETIKLSQELDEMMNVFVPPTIEDLSYKYYSHTEKISIKR
ncbi:aspartyl-phosphate phosphatase Spo0E family protein [Sutcliffiella halmapala]|uniref:aspartyl-phosphate phosphatase Spo0E family protein n=1 Tax=Sutcliffiella halmapala TaxID=79882 RepID=UPI000994BBEE|nr:aspartyl-phosphate phosphatase Spo0E family protein [Sutcliffiella halmapala]